MCFRPASREEIMPVEVQSHFQIREAPYRRRRSLPHHILGLVFPSYLEVPCSEFSLYFVFWCSVPAWLPAAVKPGRQVRYSVFLVRCSVFGVQCSIALPIKNLKFFSWACRRAPIDILKSEHSFILRSSLFLVQSSNPPSPFEVPCSLFGVQCSMLRVRCSVFNRPSDQKSKIVNVIRRGRSIS